MWACTCSHMCRYGVSRCKQDVCETIPCSLNTKTETQTILFRPSSIDQKTNKIWKYVWSLSLQLWFICLCSKKGVESVFVFAWSRPPTFLFNFLNKGFAFLESCMTHLHKTMPFSIKAYKGRDGVSVVLNQD